MPGTSPLNLTLGLNISRPTAITEAIEALATDGGLEERGAVYTKSGVVGAILDLCGYHPSASLANLRLLEPSFGDGDFLLEAVDRLLDAYRRESRPKDAAHERLSDAIRGVELHRPTFEKTSKRVEERIVANGFSQSVASKLVHDWLTNDDFLLTEGLGNDFDFVVGNPPYVRQERVPNALLREYKARYSTLYDRADLYVLFYERGLDLLKVGGVLGYICANRWIKNKYGGALREKIGRGFRLRYFIDLEQADAFHSEVIAYPAITVLERGDDGPSLVALGNRTSTTGLSGLAKALEAADQKGGVSTRAVVAVSNVVSGRDPWLLDAPEILATLRDLEQRYPTLEEAEAKVGIGVATGADKVFIGPYDELPVEPERKLPIAMAADCSNQAIRWSGKGVVNPYLVSGDLAALGDFPCFAAYLTENEDSLRRRHTARSNPTRWYKTIDRIYPTLAKRSKLLIPDIKGDATVAYDEGNYYPHHNLYVVTSDEWDLRALKAILRSSVALMFVAAYCVRMSGGFLRFQAQYLRRIRCPKWGELAKDQRHALIAVSASHDQAAIDSVVLPLYRLSHKARLAVEAYARDARVKSPKTS